MNLKELRVSKGLTQNEVSDLVDIPLRTYKNYENDINKRNTIKYKYIINELKEYGFVDENHGILSLDEIKKTCQKVFENYNVNYCYLFGSYATGNASDQSDVDLLISTDTTGLAFFGLVEELRNELKKKVDLLAENQLDNQELVKEILKDGIKIYG